MELVRMAVDSSCRGQGVARKLVERVAYHAKEHDCGWVVLSTSSEMQSAVGTYQSLGFESTLRGVSMAFAAKPDALLAGCQKEKV